jgi:hypothetical protein
MTEKEKEETLSEDERAKTSLPDGVYNIRYDFLKKKTPDFMKDPKETIAGWIEELDFLPRKVRIGLKDIIYPTENSGEKNK